MHSTPHTPHTFANLPSAVSPPRALHGHRAKVPVPSSCMNHTGHIALYSKIVATNCHAVAVQQGLNINSTEHIWRSETSISTGILWNLRAINHHLHANHTMHRRGSFYCSKGSSTLRGSSGTVATVACMGPASPPESCGASTTLAN